ncbi:hypothetical protein Tco_1418198 [Tanacetum coccineum]
MSIQDMEDLKQQYLDEMKSLINEIQIKDYLNENIDIEIKINELKENFNGMSIEINKKKKLQQLEQVANLSTYPSQHFNSFCYDDDDDDDDDDDEEFSIPMSEIYKNEEYESSVEDHNLTPSESEDLSDIENPHHFNGESDLIESLLNQDTSIISSPKFDSLLEEFSDELAHIDLISTKINKAEFDPEEEIRLVEKFGSDSLMEEIDIFLAPDDSIPLGIENDDYDSERDILEELLNNDSLSLPENESFHFDRYYDPSSPRPPVKTPDDDGIHFDIEPDMGILTAKVVDDNSEHYVLMTSILPTHPTCCLVIDTLLPFSSQDMN